MCIYVYLYVYIYIYSHTYIVNQNWMYILQTVLCSHVADASSARVMQTFLRIAWLQSCTWSSMLCHNIRCYTLVIWCNPLVARVATQNPGCSGRDWWLVERLRRHPFDLVAQHPDWPGSACIRATFTSILCPWMDFFRKPCLWNFSYRLQNAQCPFKIPSLFRFRPYPTWLKSSSSTSKRRASTRQRTFCKTASPQILQLCGECEGVQKRIELTNGHVIGTQLYITNSKTCIAYWK